ncbi:hypothetical protein VTI28DRAFT_1609 [Corynascus sepedonium]
MSTSSKLAVADLNPALLTGSIGAAVLYLAMVRVPPSRWRMVVKTASTALLSAVTAVRDGPLLLVGALALGSLGDAFLAWDDDGSFLAGLASFLVAHLLYIGVFLQTNANYQEGIQAVLQSWRAAAAGGLILLISGMIFILMPRINTELRAPVVLYSLTIMVMALTALTLGNDRAVVGSLMFSASDGILATDRFLVSPASSHRPWMQYAVWILYYSGQLLIALGVLPSDDAKITLI